MKNTGTYLQQRNQELLQDVHKILKYRHVLVLVHVLGAGAVLIVLSELKKHCCTVVEGKHYSPDTQNFKLQYIPKMHCRKYFARSIFQIYSLISY